MTLIPQHDPRDGLRSLCHRLCCQTEPSELAGMATPTRAPGGAEPCSFLDVRGMHSPGF